VRLERAAERVGAAEMRAWALGSSVVAISP